MPPSKPKRERSDSPPRTDGMPGRQSPGIEEAVQTLSQLSDLVNQSQTMSQQLELAWQRAGGSQPSLDLGLPSQPELIPPIPKPIQHYSLDSPSNAAPIHLHKTARGTRRGPMDEMRQLARILVKIIPHSVGLLVVGEEGGGACG